MNEMSHFSFKSKCQTFLFLNVGEINALFSVQKVYVYIENNKKYIIKPKRNVFITDQYNQLKIKKYVIL